MHFLNLFGNRISPFCSTSSSPLNMPANINYKPDLGQVRRQRPQGFTVLWLHGKSGILLADKRSDGLGKLPGKITDPALDNTISEEEGIS